MFIIFSPVERERENALTIVYKRHFYYKPNVVAATAHRRIISDISTFYLHSYLFFLFICYMRIVIVVELSLFFIKHTAVSLNENCKVISLQKNKRRSIRLLQIISVLLVIVHVYSLKSQIILIPYLICLSLCYHCSLLFCCSSV